MDRCAELSNLRNGCDWLVMFRSAHNAVACTRARSILSRNAADERSQAEEEAWLRGAVRKLKYYIMLIEVHSPRLL